MRQPSRVARRYAGALFNVARQQNVVESVERDLLLLDRFLEEHPQVLTALTVPRVPPERRKAALHGLVGERLEQPLTRRFLDMIVDHAREASLPEMAAAFTQLSDEARNVVAADVRTAAPLDDGQTARLKARLDQLTGRDTRLNITTDPSLVGGLVVRIGDTILDGSVRGYLEQFESQLRNAPLAAINLDAIPTGEGATSAPPPTQ